MKSLLKIININIFDVINICVEKKVLVKGGSYKNSYISFPLIKMFNVKESVICNL